MAGPLDDSIAFFKQAIDDRRTVDFTVFGDDYVNGKDLVTDFNVLKMQNKALLEVVKFYADPNNYKPVEQPTNVSEDGGKRARNVINIFFGE